MKKHNWARKVAWILCLSLLLTCLPSYSFAESEGTATTMAVEQSTGESEADKASEAKSAKEKKSEAKKEDTEKSAASEASEKKSDEKADSDKAAEKKTEAGKAEEKSESGEKSDGGSQGESKTDDKSGSDKADERTTEKQSGESASEAKSESKTDSGKADSGKTDEKSESKTDSEKTDSDSSDKKDDKAQADDGDQADEKSTEKDDADKSEASEATEETPVFKARMKFATLKRYAKEAPEKVAENKTVTVRIYEDGTCTDESYAQQCGKINKDTVKQFEDKDKEYVGAFVVTSTTDEQGNPKDNEDEIKYIGKYTSETDGKEYIYYGFSETPDTGILLDDTKQYIKLVYRTVYDVSYEVRQDSISGTVINKDGMLQDDGSVKKDSGGGFVTATTTLGKDDELHVQFKEEKNAGNNGKDYVLDKLYRVNANGTADIKEVTVDADKTATLTDVSSDVKLIAVVKPVTEYKLIDTVTSEVSRLFICWAGNPKEKNSNVQNPYQDDLVSKFCSYDTDGSVTGTKGATVKTTPGGTIYFVMYTYNKYKDYDSDDKWNLEYLKINGTTLDTTLDRKEHTTDLGNGMTAHFLYGEDGFDYKDSHLQGSNFNGPPTKKRYKYMIWVTNVSADISVDYWGDSDKREILTLVQADGIDKVVASSYDTAINGVYWDGIYNGDNSQNDVSGHGGQKFPDNSWKAGNALGKQLVNEYWGGILGKGGNRSSDNEHSSIEYEHSSSGRGSEYVYFNLKPGYDPYNTKATITGQDEALSVENIAGLVSKSYKNGTRGIANKALSTAKKEGYTWYVYYKGVGQFFRQLRLAASPYTYQVTYDLDGGTLNGATAYADPKSGTYTIESGKNTIVLPSATPEKKGHVFMGWSFEPTNQDPAYKNAKTTYSEGDKLVIDETSYAWGLQTEKTEYKLEDDTTLTEWVPVSGGTHGYAFKAVWQKDTESSTKANYTITSYREITQAAYDALAENARTTKNDKYYQKISGPTTHVGTVGETVIGIPADPEAGYVLSDASVTKLENFKKDSNTDTELIYYYEVVHTLTVKKAASGDYADKTKEFSVTVTVKDAQGNALTGSYDATGEADNVKDGKITFTDGTAKLLLKDSESVTISGLPTGTYSVSETLSTDVDKKNYTATYSVDGATAPNTAPSDQPLKFDLDANNKIQDAASSVTITNTRREETPTGVVDGQSPNGMLAAILVLFAAVIAMRKRGLFEYLGQEIKGRGRDRQE